MALLKPQVGAPAGRAEPEGTGRVGQGLGFHPREPCSETIREPSSTHEGMARIVPTRGLSVRQNVECRDLTPRIPVE